MQLIPLGVYLSMTAVNVVDPWGIAWNTEVTVVGMFVVLFLMFAFDLLYPRSHVKLLNNRLSHADETNERNSVALERIADYLEKREVADDTVQRIMSAIQENAAESRSE